MHDDDTRSRLLDAAGKAFAEKGFQGATVREICGQAEVNVAAVNYHFGDKERLYIEAIKRAHRLRSMSISMPEWADGTSPEQKLRDFVRTLIRRMTAVDAAPWQHQLMMREMASPTQAVAELVEDSIRPEFDLLVAILREVLTPGQAVSPQQMHQIAFSVVGQCMFYKVGLPVARMLVGETEFSTVTDADVIADHISSFTLAALTSGAKIP